MTFLQDQYRKGLLRNIHQHRTYSGLYACNAWEDYLFVRYGVTSSKDLSIKELNRILDVFNGKVEDVLALKQDFAGRAIMKQSTKEGGITPKQIGTIISLWEKKANDKSLRALLHFVKRVSGTLYLALEHLKKSEATNVIVAILKVK